MAARFKASYVGIGEMLVADYMIAHVGERADAVLVRCVETAPIYLGPYDTHRGRYAESFRRSEETIKTSGKGTRRALGRVENTAPEAFYVEFGARRRGIEAHHTMSMALDAAVY